MKINKLTIMLIILTLLQLLRVFSKKIIFLFKERTLVSDLIVNIIFMAIIIGIMIFIIRKNKMDLNIFPKKNKKIYIALTILLVLFMISTVAISNNWSAYNISSLMYNALITVIYEELIFRGFVWKELENSEKTKNDNKENSKKESKKKLNIQSLKPYIISTILFGLWHIGYVDTIIWRTSYFHHNVSIPNIIFWKVITGMVLGILFGFARHKNKNVYSSILLHSFINTFGG